MKDNIKVRSFEELLKVKAGEQPTYNELLHTIEWEKRRNEIINRDGYCCKKCGAKGTYSRWDRHFSLVDKVFDTRLKKEFYERWDKAERENGEVKKHFPATEDDYEKVPPYTEIIMVEEDQHYHLEVHHKYYIYNSKPWEYDDSALVSLCNNCHFEVHQTEVVKCFKKENGELVDMHLNPCIKCSGTGYLPEFHYKDGGICYRCMGQRYEEIIIRK